MWFDIIGWLIIVIGLLIIIFPKFFSNILTADPGYCIRVHKTYPALKKIHGEKKAKKITIFMGVAFLIIGIIIVFS